MEIIETHADLDRAVIKAKKLDESLEVSSELFDDLNAGQGDTPYHVYRGVKVYRAGTREKCEKADNRRCEI